MNTTRHLEEEDLALFALQLMQDDELRAAVDHLEVCEDCRHDVARFQGDLTAYGLALSPMETPPEAARERLLKAVAREKKIIPEPRYVAPLRRSSAAVPIARESLAADPVPSQPAAPTESTADRQPEVFFPSRGGALFGSVDHDTETTQARQAHAFPGSLLGWAGWAVAAGLALLAGLQFRERQETQRDLAAVTTRLSVVSDDLGQAEQALQTLKDARSMQVDLHLPVNDKPAPPQPEGHAAYNAASGALVFLANHLKPLDPNKTYELWLIPAEKDGVRPPPVPAGLFKPDARGIATLMMPPLARGVQAQAFAVTIEDEAGAKAPTSKPILEGL